MGEITIAFEQPNPKQIKMFEATTKHIGFGGARGGGKSWAVRTKAKLLAAMYPGIRILIVRQTYEDLEENHISILIDDLAGISKYSDKKKRITLINGSKIKFAYCQYDKDIRRFQGKEYDIIFIDEATQLSEKQMKAITASCRGANDFPHRIYYTCNPGDQGHGYIKRIFIDKNYKSGENPEDYTFIQSLVFDNTALMEHNPDYVQQLKALDAKTRKAWLEGRWDIFSGEYFEDFRIEPDRQLCEKLGITPEAARASHQCVHVIEPFDIPPEWTIYRSFDWGYSKPFSCGWWAVDFDGVLYRIAEFYGCVKDEPNTGVKMEPNLVFKEIHRIETEHKWLKGKEIQGVADPAIWNAERGESIADIAAKYQVYFTKGDHQRLPGWMQMHYRFQFDENGYPMMYIFSNCKSTIRTLPLLMYDDHKVEDLDTNGEDHIADDIRYMCMNRPIKPIKAVEPSKYKQSMLYQALEIPEGDLRKPSRHTRIQRL